MRLRRRVDDPTARLWRELESWFRDEDLSYAGGDVEFDGLTPEEVERGWAFLAEKADPLNPSHTVWDDHADKKVSVVEMMANGAIAAAARSPGVIVGLYNVEVGSARLPWLGITLWSAGLAPYWWISDDSGWEPHSVAGLAILLHQLRDEVLPAAAITLERGDDVTFWNAIDTYIATVEAQPTN